MKTKQVLLAFPFLLALLAMLSCSDSRLEGVMQYEKSIRTVINTYEERSMSSPDSLDNIALESLDYLKAIVPIKGGENLHRAAIDYMNFHLKNTNQYNIKISKLSEELDKIYGSDRADTATVKLSESDSLAREARIEGYQQKMQSISETYYPRLQELRNKLREAQKELGNKNNIEFKDIEFIYEGDGE